MVDHVRLQDTSGLWARNFKNMFYRTANSLTTSPIVMQYDKSFLDAISQVVKDVANASHIDVEGFTWGMDSNRFATTTVIWAHHSRNDFRSIRITVSRKSLSNSIQNYQVHIEGETDTKNHVVESSTDVNLNNINNKLRGKLANAFEKTNRLSRKHVKDMYQRQYINTNSIDHSQHPSSKTNNAPQHEEIPIGIPTHDMPHMGSSTTYPLSRAKTWGG